MNEMKNKSAPAAVAVQLDANGIAPCPLCGSESKHVKADVGGHRILCWNDGCECSSGYFYSKEEAVTSWNTRAALAATPAAAPDMVSVNKEDANNYCRILTALSMEEDGDPVAEVQSLLAAAAAPVAQTEVTWCEYIAGMIGCYLKEPDDSPRVKAIEGIIARRLWALPSAATATGLPAQEVAYIDSEVLTSFLSSSNYRPEDGWDCHIRHQENKRDTDVPLYSRPQAQADARDAALAASEQDALRLVRQAVRDFHYALDNRKHGGVAAGAAMNAIELALNMYWQQGQEADRRAAIAAAKGEA